MTQLSITSLSQHSLLKPGIVEIDRQERNSLFHILFCHSCQAGHNLLSFCNVRTLFHRCPFLVVRNKWPLSHSPTVIDMYHRCTLRSICTAGSIPIAGVVINSSVSLIDSRLKRKNMQKHPGSSGEFILAESLISLFDSPERISI